MRNCLKAGVAKHTAVLCFALSMFACGGSDMNSPPSVKVLPAPPASSATAQERLSGSRNHYQILLTSDGFVVTDVVGHSGSRLINATSVRFDDVTLNLAIAGQVKTISEASLQSLIELYIAFFNRVPDADGLSYWVDQVKAGASREALANHFYAAAILYSSVTNYSSTMSDADFVRVIYKNVLGRDDIDQQGLDYWTAALAKPIGTPGAESRGTLISSIIFAAHSYKGDTKYGYVADLLDNKVAVARYFAIQQGLNYNSPEQSISEGVRIAKAVKYNDTLAAKAIIGMADVNFDLVTMKAPASNAALQAYDDILILAQDQVLNFDYLTTNDVATEPASLKIVVTTSPLFGSLTRISQNIYTYRPAAGFVGEDRFRYTVMDAQGAVQTAQVVLAVNKAIDAAQIRASLLTGVSSLSDSPTRGFASAFGPTVINLSNFPATQTPMAVAGTMGAGRILALSGLHWASLDKVSADKMGDMSRLMNNALKWLSGKDSKSMRIVRNHFVEMATWLSTNGYHNVLASNDFAKELTGADVLVVWLGGNPSTATIEAVTQYVQNGGALLIVEFGAGFKGQTGWWQATIDQAGGNRVLRKAGVVFGGRWNEASAPLTINMPQQLSDEELMKVLKTPDAYTYADKNALAENLSVVTSGLPPHDTLLARLDSRFDAITATITPSISHPVTDAFSKAILEREVAMLKALPIQEMRPHRTAEASFGAIPKNAPRSVNQQVSVNGNWSGMLATGMYAAPGELVSVTVPPELINKGYFIRLSGHVDDIGPYNNEWRRMPDGIQRSVEIKQATTQVASPYGGAIYIDVLDGADSKTRRAYGDLKVFIHGALEAPYFVLGKTTNMEWVNRIRQNPAPYAELVSDHLAVSVPSSMIRTLENPEELTRYWNDYVAFQDWVGGTENDRTGPDRINFDAQISVGYLHAGYPIQGPYDVESSINFLNLDSLRKEGEWGYFHEMGHEMQRQDQLWDGFQNGFTFDGDVEVTVNIFAKAALDKMAPFATPTSGWGWAAYPGRVLSKAKKTINDSSKQRFDEKDPYPFYFSLADGFGWPVYRQVLSSYVDDARNNHNAFPVSNQDRKDQWLIRWSKYSGYNMIEYMVNRWRLEVSQSAINTVAAMGLPSWLPATTNIDHFKMAANTNKQLDLRNTGVSLSGGASFVRIIPGSQHTMTENDDGTFKFTPNLGFIGRDQFKVVYRSEAGNEVETIVNVEVGN